LNVVSIDSGGDSGMPLTLRAWPGTGVPILDGMGMRNDAIDVNAPYVLVDGLELRGGGEHGISMNGPAKQHITVLRCDIHDNGSTPTTPFDNRAGVIVNNGASDLTVAECRIHDNVNAGFDVDGIRALNGSSEMVTRLTIADNVIFGNTTHGLNLRIVESFVTDNRIYENGVDGIHADGNAIIIRDNRTCDAGRHGVFLAGLANATVVNNTAVGNAMHGIHVQAPSSTTELVANVMTGNGTAGAWSDANLADGYNVYFDNGEDAVGFMRAQPMTDIFDDPMLMSDADPCSAFLGPTSPAIGHGPDGTDIGARR
jgi:serralysin